MKFRFTLLLTVCTALFGAGSGMAETITVNPGDNLQTALSNAVESDVTLLFPSGGTFDLNANLSIKANLKSVTLTGMANNKASITRLGKFRIQGDTLTALSVSNVNITGIANGYIVSESEAKIIGRISFSGCDISDMRGFMRFTSTPKITVIDTFKVYNSIVHDINHSNSLGFVGVGSGPPPTLYNNILIDSCTFYNHSTSFIVTGRKVNTISAKNSTFYKIGVKGSILFDFPNSADSIPNTFAVENCIFSTAYFEDQDGDTIKATRSNVVPNYVTDSYQASDYKTNPALKGITAYSGTATDLFTDPATANFTLKDAFFDGKKVGDPRWYYKSGEGTSTPAIKDIKGILSRQYFDLTGKSLAKEPDTKGLFIEKVIHEDGTVYTHKLLKN
ncbi:MAG: DUF5123 domain-containing protein [Dysgonamonadaceae bacterium]|jgi:hypothetical protein|nr:DUF5123 domain-containing protein [Dysgonamonadaceae bacterium]